MTVGIFFILAGVYAGASVIQGLTGFGYAVVAVPIAATLTSPATAIAYNVVNAGIISAQKAVILRDHVDWRFALKFWAVMVPFIPLGVIFISRMSREAAVASMGAWVVVAAVLQLAGGGTVFRRAMQTRTAFGVSAGLTGVLAGAFSIPGPACVPYILSRFEDPLAGQASISLFYAMLSIPVLVMHVFLGGLEPVEMLRGLLFLPATMIPTIFATRWTKRMKSNRLRIVVAIAMVAFGIYLVVSSLLKR